MNSEKHLRTSNQKSFTIWDKFFQFLQMIIDALKEMRFSYQWTDANGNLHNFKFGETV